MKRLPYAFIAALIVLLGGSLTTYAVSTFITGQGGTGTTTPSGILYGDNGATTHLNTVSIGSNLTFSGGILSATGGGGGSGTVSTSSSETSSRVPYWTTTSGTPALLSGGFSGFTTDGSKVSITNASTTNLSIGSLTGFLKATAGAVSTSLISLTSDVTGVLPIANGGTATSTSPSYGQVLVGNLLGGYDYVATSTFGGGGGTNYFTLTGNKLQNNVGNALGIGIAPNSATLEAIGTTSDTTAAGLAIWNSLASTTLYARNDGNVGIGTTTPGAALSIVGPDSTLTSPYTINTGAILNVITRGQIVSNIIKTLAGTATMGAFDYNLLNLNATSTTAYTGRDIRLYIPATSLVTTGLLTGLNVLNTVTGVANGGAWNGIRGIVGAANLTGTASTTGGLTGVTGSATLSSAATSTGTITGGSFSATIGTAGATTTNSVQAGIFTASQTQGSSGSLSGINVTANGGTNAIYGPLTGGSFGVTAGGNNPGASATGVSISNSTSANSILAGVFGQSTTLTTNATATSTNAVGGNFSVNNNGPTGNVLGVQMTSTNNYTGAAVTAVAGLSFQAINAGITSTTYGQNMFVFNSGTTTSSLSGAFMQVNNSAVLTGMGTGVNPTYTNASVGVQSGLAAGVNTTATNQGIINNGNSLYGILANATNSGTINSGGNIYGINVSATNSGTMNGGGLIYDVYGADTTALNYFAGNTLIGGSNSANALGAELRIGTTTANYTGQTLFSVENSSSASLFNVYGNGNVGIGTTTPYAALSLGGGNLVLGAATAGGTPGDLFLPKLGTAAGSFLAVDTSGKVIATTTPTSGVSSVSNADGTLTVSPTTGAVVASLALGHANTWTGLQQFNGAASSTNLSANFAQFGGTATTTFTTAGLVGIGSSTPYAELSLNAPAGTAPYFVIGSSTEVFKITPSTSATMGVGTSTPWRTLSITGTVGFDGLTASAGLQTGVLCLSSNKEVINDSVACVASARRFKQNIQPEKASNALSQILQLQTVSYLYKPEFNGSLQSDPNYSRLQVGLIADDVQKINPSFAIVETASTTFEGKSYPAGIVKGIDYNAITATIIGAIKEIVFHQSKQDRQIAELQAQVKMLQAQNKK